jgi:hypothetical protein
MSGRRRHDRFEIADPWDGSLRLLREVVLGTPADDGVTVISHTAAAIDEVMRLDVRGRTATAFHVKVTDSRPVTYGGSVRHAVHFAVLPGGEGAPAFCGTPGAAGTTHDAAAVLAAPEAVGVLTRNLPVRMRNVSASGCLLESASTIEEGTVARLRIRIAEREFRDDVRVIRCRRVEGAGSTHHVGVEFVWTTQPGARSLRWRLRTFAARAGAPNSAGALGHREMQRE